MNDAIDVLDLADIAAIDALPEVDVDDSGLYVADGTIEEDPTIGMQHPTCPPPTRWRLVSQAKARGNLRIVSSAISARSAPIRHTFRVARSFSFSTAVTAGIKVGVPLLEAETGLSLTTTLTITTMESATFTVPKGSTMALFGGAGYFVRTFERTVYGSAMCNAVVQRTTVSTPYMKILEVRNV